jgi:hypothetical protein
VTHVVAPDRLIAAWWAVMTGLLTAGAIWLVVDSGGGWYFLALLAAAVVVCGWFFVQAVVPSLLTFRIDEQGLAGQFLWRRIDIPWADVHLLRVDAFAGDSLLEITTASDGRTLLLPLPVGTSLGRLHRVLAATIGRQPPASGPALDATT